MAACNLIQEVIEGEPDVRKAIQEMTEESIDVTEDVVLRLLAKVLKLKHKRKAQLTPAKLHECLHHLVSATAQDAVKPMVSDQVESMVHDEVQATLKPLMLALQHHFQSNNSTTPPSAPQPYHHYPTQYGPYPPCSTLAYQRVSEVLLLHMATRSSNNPTTHRCTSQQRRHPIIRIQAPPSFPPQLARWSTSTTIRPFSMN
jgi:hypothetical protein